MDKFIHRENLALFGRRLDDPALTDAQRKAILRQLTEEQVKGTTAEINLHGLSPSQFAMTDVQVGVVRDDKLILINAANEWHQLNFDG
jgi:hypothetical protein